MQPNGTKPPNNKNQKRILKAKAKAPVHHHKFKRASQKASLAPPKSLYLSVMEEDGDDYPRSPFWLQSTTNLGRAVRYRRRASSLLFNLGSLVLLLLVAAILFMVFVIPSLVRHTSQVFKPNLVKRSWDWINLVLVLFALAFGFLSRNRNEDRNYDGYPRTSSNGAPKSNPSTPHQQWYDFPDQTVFNNSSAMAGLRRHRTSSSYPDLRELSPPVVADDDPWRFADDTHLNSSRVWGSDHPLRRPSWKELDRQISVTKDVIHVDNLVNRLTQVSHAPPPPPPSPPPPPETSASPAAKKKTKRTYQSLGHDQEKLGRKGQANLEPKKTVTEEEEDKSPAPPSPPPVMAAFQEMELKSSRSDRKRSGSNATKDFLTSFYSKKKKKRQRQRSVDNLDTLLHHPQPAPLRFQLPPPSPPPPPPPPPPPSVFHNLFTSKKDKRKKITPTTAAIRTPPPPPPPTAARGPKPATWKAPISSQKPPMPEKIHNFNNIDDGLSGGESPLRRIPPPPPPPPFRIPDLKYVVEGDYARLLSTDSSRSGSPDLDEVESPSSDNNSPSPFCPSPDVDTKADSFIAKFRAGLKLEKVNSFNQKQGQRMSNLGPNSGSPNQS